MWVWLLEMILIRFVNSSNIASQDARHLGNQFSRLVLHEKSGFNPTRPVKALHYFFECAICPRHLFDMVFRLKWSISFNLIYDELRARLKKRKHSVFKPVCASEGRSS
jgi:hypothetical protein